MSEAFSQDRNLPDYDPQSIPATKVSFTLLHSILDAIPEPTIVINVDWKVIFANQAACDLSGMDPIPHGTFCYKLSHHRDRPCGEYGEQCPLREVIATKQPLCVTHKHYDVQGREMFVEITAAPIFDAAGGVVQIVESCRDVSEAKGVRHLLEIANRHTGMESMLEDFVEALRKLTGCSAIAIRVLDNNGEINHHAQVGFSQEFCKSEGLLSIHSHQCLCINVITGNVDIDAHCCTQGGSILIDSTSHFLNSLSESTKNRYRNVCNEFGFESLALIPICDGGQILGLIQMADCKENMISARTVEAIEQLAMHLGTAIQRVHAKEALKAAHDGLELAVQHRTAELARTNKALTQEIAERTRLEKEILQISANEQQRIGQDLHDGVGQELTGLSCLAGSLKKKLEAKHLPEAHIAEELSKGIPKTLEYIESIVQGLIPLEIGSEDLVPALQLLADNMREQTGIPCRFYTKDTVFVGQKHAAIQIYRIAQEAIANAIRHASANNIVVTLIEQDHETILQVRDDGIGIDLKRSASGAGLRIMAYRARAIGGTLEVFRNLDAGTVVTCRFPGGTGAC